MSEETQAVTEVTTEAPATEPNVAPAETAEGTPPADQQVEAKTFTQEELDAIVQKRLDKERRKFERKQIEMETRVRVQQEQQVEIPAEIPKPKESDFESYSEYLEALSDWKVDVKLRQKEIEQATSAQRASQESENRRLKELHDSTIERGEQKYEDFEEVAQKTGDMLKSKGLRFSAAMVNSLVEAENAPDIVYFLGNNLDEAERIAKLPAYAQAKEIGKLEDKLSAKKPVKTSNAPEPIKPLGNGTSAPVDLAKVSMDDYMKHRLKDKPVWAR
jgi:hypothetical protein